MSTGALSDGAISETGGDATHIPPLPSTAKPPRTLATCKDSPTKIKLRKKLRNYQIKVHRLRQKITKLEALL
jgi:hypothetical protein